MEQTAIIQTEKAQEIKDIIWGVIGVRELLVDLPAEAESEYLDFMVDKAVESVQEVMDK